MTAKFHNEVIVAYFKVIEGGLLERPEKNTKDPIHDNCQIYRDSYPVSAQHKPIQTTLTVTAAVSCST
jgi:hypothetical protein